MLWPTKKIKGSLKYPMNTGLWLLLGTVTILLVILIGWQILQGRVSWKIVFD
ncbi:MAG: hypothetical protein ABEK17_04680 [Candidatus Aenigmatarchaeota archaeon]